ncbi:unnamed protein product [Coffea canephora]|uniref:DH200=94 genomic scaffold, scaffold_156 n=1 Tax=Coffea canephora TaxID=49390 RepID=A0A068V9N8_COFCA|nr:unnamed protein product [Coffea canephora]
MATSVFLLTCFLLVLGLNVVNGQPLVPALYLFGDSIVDVGNNNYLETLIKANFPPYGRDFINHEATGRFCNGKLATDFTGENLGFTDYPKPYLSNKAKTTKNMLLGANFASAGSGYYEATAKIYTTLSLSKQLALYKDYQNRLVVILGKVNASATINGSIHFLSDGSSDFVQNYYINPLLYKKYTPDQFSDILIQSYVNFVKVMFSPRTLLLSDCISATAIPGPNLNLLVLDIYQPLLDLVTKPIDNGFFEARKACCGSGLIETSFLCNAKSPGTCANASEYVFWDGFHPTEAANKVLSNDLLVSGLNLI